MGATPATARRRLLASLALASIAVASGAARADDAAPGVLVLYSNQRPTPAQLVIEDTLRTVLAEGGKPQIQLFSEYLDDEWVSLETYGVKQADFLRSKYERRNIKVIVAVAIPALQFATRFRNQVVAGAPIVHVLVARDRVDPERLPPGVVGNFEDNDPLPTLQLALRLHTDARRLVVIRGASERDQLWDKRVHSAIERLGAGNLPVEIFAGLSTPEVLSRVAALPPKTLIYTPGWFVDGAGQVTTPRQATERIAAASAVAVYGAFDTFIGSGIVGGYMTPYEAQAREAGAIIIRLLDGTPASEIAPASVKRVPMVDWRQLRRWRLDESRLPPGTVVAYREPSVFAERQREIYIGMAALVLQTALIGALLLQRRARRRTALALEESQRQMTLATNAARLSFWNWATCDAPAPAEPAPRSRSLPSDPALPFGGIVRSVHPADRQRLQHAVDRALATGEEFDIEYRVLDPGGGVQWISARGRPQKDNPGRLAGVAFDITERKANELRVEQDRAALRQLSRVSMVGQLSAAIAHQLNQPLAAILGNAEAAQKMLDREAIDVQELRAICADIVGEDHRASEVIRRLRELYHRGDVAMESVDVNRLVRETLNLLRSELQFRHVTVTTDLQPALPLVRGGKVQLQQVLLNMILNATDAMSGVNTRERRIVLRTDFNDGEVRIWVVDNGTGISAGDLERVFEPFWSSKPQGMGMGLAICRSIVSAHRGRIVAMNNTEHGATFFVILPPLSPGAP